MHVVIADCETNGFLETMTKFWCLQIGDAEGNDSVIYTDETEYLVDAGEGIKILKRVPEDVLLPVVHGPLEPRLMPFGPARCRSARKGLDGLQGSRRSLEE